MLVDLRKKFGSFEALKKVSMSVSEGEVVSLLGHNGAGKSTLINIITGIYKPTSGKIYYKGKDFG